MKYAGLIADIKANWLVYIIMFPFMCFGVLGALMMSKFMFLFFVDFACLIFGFKPLF